MMNFVHALREELRAIQSDVAKLEAESASIQARLRLALDKANDAKSLLARYGDVDVEPPTQQVLESVISNIPRPTVRANVDQEARPLSKAARIKAEVTEILNARGTEHRLKLLNHLVEKGLMGAEKNPLAAFAAYLSNNKDVFLADGRGNFSLRRESHREPLPVPGSGAGSVEETTTAPSTLEMEGGVS